MRNEIEVANSTITSRIMTIRGVQAILDWDIAELYGVETRVLNQAVKRNIERFPDRFRFVLTKSELNELITKCDKSQTKRHYPGTPAAFTEQGIAMLSAILRSPTAIEVSIRIMDAFVAMRHFIVTNAGVLQRLGAVEVKQIAMDEKLNKVLGQIERKEFPARRAFGRCARARRRFKTPEASATAGRPFRPTSTPHILNSETNRELVWEKGGKAERT